MFRFEIIVRFAENKVPKVRKRSGEYGGYKLCVQAARKELKKYEASYPDADEVTYDLWLKNGKKWELITGVHND